ncbi:hypothetical protein [Methylobacterium sp. E-005]|uniref:hypothetical protein n=1 Tax=Methylobacterium sp. E-005 TaxID=2836549 RepID=UPI001FBAB894|nr:hypothetical protein [Methylobacterium sp. E-005]
MRDSRIQRPGDGPALCGWVSGIGDRKNVQPMAARTEGIRCVRLHHFIAFVI